MLAEGVEAHVVSIVRPTGYVQVEREAGIVIVTIVDPAKERPIPSDEPSFEGR